MANVVVSTVLSPRFLHRGVVDLSSSDAANQEAVESSI